MRQVMLRLAIDEAQPGQQRTKATIAQQNIRLFSQIVAQAIDRPDWKVKSQFNGTFLKRLLQ